MHEVLRRIFRFPGFRIFTAAGLAVLCCACGRQDYPATYREFAYVTNGKSNSVSVIDTRAFRFAATIPVGENPTGISANPRRNEIYAVNSRSGTVSVIDAERNQVSAVIGVGRLPYFIDVSPDGTRGYVANSGSNDISVVDLGRRRVIANIHVGDGPGLARVAPDGGTIVVSNRRSNSVSVIDASSLRVRATVDPMCREPTDIAILPDSSKAFVACSGSSQVSVIALRGKIMPNDRMLVLLDVGRLPVQLALKPDGGEIYSSNFASDTISEIATGNNETGGSYAIGHQPVRCLFSADNAFLYVSNFGSDTVAIFAVNDGKLFGTAHVGNQPDGLALSPNQSFLFVVDTGSGDVAVVRTRAVESALPGPRQVVPVLTLIPVGQQPNAIVIKGFLAKGAK